MTGLEDNAAATGTPWKQELTAIVRAHGVPFEAMQSASRSRHIVAARWEAWAMLRARGWSLSSIGALFKRAHTTVMHGLAKRAERQRNGGPMGDELTLLEQRQSAVRAGWARRNRRRPGGSYMPPTPGMVFRDAWERIETRESNHRAEARRRRASAMAVKPIATVTLMADDANEKVRRVRVMDGVERAFRKGLVDEEGYRIARCIEADVLALLPPSGGMKLERMRDCGASRADGGEHFVLMPRPPSAKSAHIGREDALWRLRRAAEALPDGPAWSVLRVWAGEGASLYEIDARWRRRKGWALMVVQLALSLLAEAQIYEREKWKIDVLAAAV